MLRWQAGVFRALAAIRGVLRTIRSIGQHSAIPNSSQEVGTMANQKHVKKQSDDDLLTMSEICDLYRVGRDVVRKWIVSGELPALNVSTSQNARSPRWRVRRGDLTTFLESRSATALAEEQRQAVPQITESIGTLKWDPKNCTLNFVREEKRQENETPTN